MEQKHKDKVVVITGASKGIGQAYAKRFAEEGADIVLVSRSSAPETESLVKAAGRSVLDQSCDVTSEADVQALVKAVSDRFGRCDILINNAGIYPFQPIEEMSFDDWSKVLAVNLDGVFRLCKAFLPMMKSQEWGRIINTTSSVCWQVAPNVTHYMAAKMGVVGFTRGLAAEVSDAGVTVNAIAPGLVKTGTTESGPQSEMFEQVAQMQSIHRVEEPEDLTGVASFLASDDARFITGQTIAVNGGIVWR
ncbi:MAG: SDR family NAD(P)-dependent oxidoreductase [Elainellaceae cyanobacterium]